MPSVAVAGFSLIRLLMKTVMHAVEAFGGGVFYFISEFSLALGEDFRFVVLHGTRSETPPDFQRFFPPGTEFIAWPSAGRELSPSGDRAALSEFREAVARVRPDVVHAHSSKAGALARIGARRSRTPVIYSPHGYASFRRDISALRRGMYRGIEYLLGRLPHITVAVGEAEFREALKLACNAQCIPNAVPLAAPAYPVANLDQPLRVVMSGRMTAQKNFPLYCAIAEAAAGENVHFLWIGGESDSRAALPSNLEVTGWVPRPQALRLIMDADLYLQTALWEGLPLAVLEAMTLGKPVLATNIGPNRELVVQGGNGYICENVGDFVRRLKEFVQDRSLAGRMGICSRHMAENEYNVTSAVMRWRSIYDHYESYARFAP